MAAACPVRLLAGVEVPNTPLISKAIDYARAHGADFAFNHVMRCFLFGSIVVDRISAISDCDREVQAISTILHDLGWDPTGKLVSTDKRATVDSANAARDFLRREAPDWEERKLQLVWDAIALHETNSIAMHKEPEVQACLYGIMADFRGPDKMAGNVVTWPEYWAVVKEYPRLNMMEDFKELMCHFCRTKPQATYDNCAGQYGDKYVEGFSLQGKLDIDFLEAIELDRLHPPT